MTRLKIGVVERDRPFAEKMIFDLQKLGYELAPIASSQEKAIKIIEEEKPHLLLISICLNTELDGMALAQYVRENYTIPIIFVTEKIDWETIERSKDLKPNGFLEKPFTNIEMYASIELALTNYQSHLDYILVKDGYLYVRVQLEKILCIDSERNYLNIYLTTGKKIIIRSTMFDMMERLKGRNFIRINRGCIVNIEHVAQIETDKVYIGEKYFSVSKQQRDELISILEKNERRAHL